LAKQSGLQYLKHIKTWPMKLAFNNSTIQ